MRKTYVFKDGRFIDKSGFTTGYDPKHKDITAPMIISDIEPHYGPSGRYISSRSGVADECKRSGTVPWEKVDDHPGGFSNEKFAKKAGVRISEAAQEWASDKKTKAAAAAGVDMKGRPLTP